MPHTKKPFGKKESNTRFPTKKRGGRDPQSFPSENELPSLSVLLTQQLEEEEEATTSPLPHPFFGIPPPTLLTISTTTRAEANLPPFPPSLLRPYLPCLLRLQRRSSRIIHPQSTIFSRFQAYFNKNTKNTLQKKHDECLKK